MKKEICRMVAELNSNTNLPDRWMRRNVRQYQLVSAINNSVCLYLADNLAQHFIDRCYKYLDDLDIQNREPKYYLLAKEILSLISEDIKGVLSQRPNG